MLASTEPFDISLQFAEAFFQYSIGDAYSNDLVLGGKITIKSFQYSIGDARRFFQGPRRVPPKGLSIFHWRCHITRIAIVENPQFDFQYSIGDAGGMTYTMETVAGIVIFQYSIGDASTLQLQGAS